MIRRVLLAALLALPAAAQPELQDAPKPATPAERQRQLDHFWARQQEKAQADRFWNGPREARRNQSRDQFEFWNRQQDRRRGWPPYPF